jgi:imidazole glycerol-phosphate synthase subunit HisH
MRVTIFDYGAGNLHSLAKALEGPSVQLAIATSPFAAIDTDVLVLPGVGAFGPAARRILPARALMRDAIAGGLPMLGICLGMQLLFESSDEGAGFGLGVFAGTVTRLEARRSPQMGWNSIENAAGFRQVAAPRAVYYANSFACRPVDASIVAAWSTHEADRFPAIVRRGSTIGVQFHPEKSSADGVRWIRDVLDEVSR